MKRSDVRTNIFKLMFQVEFNSEDEMTEIIDLFFERFTEEHVSQNKREFMEQRVFDMIEKRQELDETINKYANGWTTERLGKAELAILRVAVYEILFDDEVPNAVAINEAVNLAKEYGADLEQTPKFINGVLAQIA